MLKHGEINPMAVWGVREVAHCPAHFTEVNFNAAVPEKQIADWIWANLSGRFYLGDRYYAQPEDSKIELCKCAAFEIPGEASLFALMLDKINSYSEW